MHSYTYRLLCLPSFLVPYIYLYSFLVSHTYTYSLLCHLVTYYAYIPKVANTVCLHYIYIVSLLFNVVGCNSLIYRVTCMAMFPIPDYTYALYCAMYSIFSLLALFLVRMQLYSPACLVHACAVS